MYVETVAYFFYEFYLMYAIDVDPRNSGFIFEWKTVFNGFHGCFLEVFFVVIKNSYFWFSGSFFAYMN